MVHSNYYGNRIYLFVGNLIGIFFFYIEKSSMYKSTYGYRFVEMKFIDDVIMGLCDLLLFSFSFYCTMI